MRGTLVKLIEAVHTSFWFIPALMTAAATALSFVTIHADDIFRQELLSHVGWLYGGGPEGARSVLAAIAGSMITVAGVVSSITIVILSLASQQFGPRILRTFIRDRANQLVLGSFVSTFIYCLLVLRTVRGGSDADFVPHISVTAGIVLAAASIAVLIFFVHHVARSIQSSSIIATIGRELDETIERLYPKESEDQKHADHQPLLENDALGEGIGIVSAVTGYVQFVDSDELLKIAARNDLLVQVVAAPGAFVRRGDHLATVCNGVCGDRVQRDMAAAFAIDDHRTGTQDISFIFQQLTEIAVRALSPGTNDPFTAIQCINQLTAALQRLAGRAVPDCERRDDTGKVRLIAQPTIFAEVAKASLGAIRRYGNSHQEVISALLSGIGCTIPYATRADDREVLLEEARGAVSAASSWNDEQAVRDVHHLFRRVFRKMQVATSEEPPGGE